MVYIGLDLSNEDIARQVRFFNAVYSRAQFRDRRKEISFVLKLPYEIIPKTEDIELGKESATEAQTESLQRTQDAIILKGGIVGPKEFATSFDSKSKVTIEVSDEGIFYEAAHNRTNTGLRAGVKCSSSKYNLQKIGEIFRRCYGCNIHTYDFVRGKEMAGIEAWMVGDELCFDLTDKVMEGPVGHFITYFAFRTGIDLGYLTTGSGHISCIKPEDQRYVQHLYQIIEKDSEARVRPAQGIKDTTVLDKILLEYAALKRD